MIRYALPNDSVDIARIYNYYVLNTAITFEENLVDSNEMRDRIVDISSSLPWFVFVQNGHVIGYAYASKWKGRCAYRYSVETTVYLDNEMKGRGIGRLLYEKLIAELKLRNFHSAIGGIALPNPQSIGLHEKLGFQKVAHFKEVGRKFDRWIDVGYWQLTLENLDHSDDEREKHTALA